PGRVTVVITRGGWTRDGVETVQDPARLPLARLPAPHFVCGGAEIYRLLLPACAELLLTRVRREVAGDAFFPPFKDRFELVETIRATPEFDIQRWRNRAPQPLAGEAAD
ncbi:MAG TPA: dihydrofolate reductase, partial [Verrucomicrobiota bacterium]|nr:dihydrofolate reductase [Verrucomicrobiota bacterium]